MSAIFSGTTSSPRLPRDMMTPSDAAAIPLKLNSDCRDSNLANTCAWREADIDESGSRQCAQSGIHNTTSQRRVHTSKPWEAQNTTARSYGEAVKGNYMY